MRARHCNGGITGCNNIQQALHCSKHNALEVMVAAASSMGSVGGGRGNIEGGGDSGPSGTMEVERWKHQRNHCQLNTDPTLSVNGD